MNGKMHWLITALVALISVIATLYASGSVFDDRYASKESVTSLAAAVERLRSDNRADHKDIQSGIGQMSQQMGKIIGTLEAHNKPSR